ncbi:MAG: ECF-type sigma factor [Planctomycetota bacterium]
MSQAQGEPDPAAATPLAGITVLLRRAATGDRVAESALATAVYSELHSMARRHMAREGKGHTLQATALVSEVWMRLLKSGSSFRDRSHYLSVAARAMKWVLIDHARKNRREKRGAMGKRVLLDEVVDLFEQRSGSLIDLGEALERMREFNPTMAHAIDLRFFGGASVEECAQILGMPRRTFERRFEIAAAWLRAELGGDVS